MMQKRRVILLSHVNSLLPQTAGHLPGEAEKTGGFVRVVAREDDHRILGIQGVGTHISELVGEWTLALEMGALLEDVAATIHAHLYD